MAEIESLQLLEAQWKLLLSESDKLKEKDNVRVLKTEIARKGELHHQLKFREKLLFQSKTTATSSDVAVPPSIELELETTFEKEKEISDEVEELTQRLECAVKEVEAKEVKRQDAFRRLSDIRVIEKRKSQGLAKAATVNEAHEPEVEKKSTGSRQSKRQLLIKDEESEEETTPEKPVTKSKPAKPAAQPPKRVPAPAKPTTITSTAKIPAAKKNLNDTSFGFVELTNVVEPSAMWEQGAGRDTEFEEGEAGETFSAGFQMPTKSGQPPKENVAPEDAATNKRKDPPAEIAAPQPKKMAPAPPKASKSSNPLDVSTLSQISLNQTQNGKRMKLAENPAKRKLPMLNASRDTSFASSNGAGKAKTQSKILASIMAGFTVPKLLKTN